MLWGALGASSLRVGQARRFASADAPSVCWPSSAISSRAHSRSRS